MAANGCLISWAIDAVISPMLVRREFRRVQLAAAAASGRRSPRSSASGQRRRRRQRCQRIKTTTVPARIESEHTSATHQPRVVGELKAIDVYFEGLVTRSMTAN